MGALNEKLKEVTFSVVPVSLFVLLLHFTVTPLETNELIRFLIGATLLIFSLAIFLLGIDLGVTPIGNYSGESLVRTNKLWIVLVGGFLFGFIINMAEPDLAILADQIAAVTRGALGRWELIVAVSIGVGMLVLVGMLRIIKSINLRTILWCCYGLIALLAIFVPQAFHAFAFDASGATTGAITVPFLLALSVGVSQTRAHREKDAAASFGLVGLASAGAILGLLLRGVFASITEFSSAGADQLVVTGGIIGPFVEALPHILWEAFISLFPLALVFVGLLLKKNRVRKRQAHRMTVGLIYCYLGLVVFLVSVKAGFMPAGASVGRILAGQDTQTLLLISGFVIGLLTILAEPAVHVLTHQIEDESAGNIPRRLVLVFLSIGVGFAIVLSLLRIIIPGLQLWHILLPGYITVFILAFFCPPLFLGIAFDSGGVASGPITATFILAFAQGAAAEMPNADVILDGFGIIALVAMMPLIALQILGILHKRRTERAEQKVNSQVN